MISVSFSLGALILFPIVFYLLHKWPKPRVEIIETSRVGIFRRIAAVYVDMGVGVIGIIPLVCMPSLIIEYFETGHWAWSFERTNFRPSDILSTFFMLLGFFVIFYYSRWHFLRGKQTLGQHLLGFVLEPMEEKTNFSIRVLVAWVNFAWWPIWPWTIMKRKQDYWWDTASNIKARRIK